MKSEGSWARYYSQWGGHALELDLLAGPDAATRFARGQRPVDWWMDEGECEGAALIDHDERRLLWFSYCQGDAAYWAAAMSVMAHSWPGWRRQWAQNGLGVILDELGEPRPLPWRSEPLFPQAATSVVPCADGAREMIVVTGSEVLRGLPGLIERFDAHQDVDLATQSISMLLAVTGALTAAAERSGLTATTAVDNSFTHRPMDLTDDERARVHAAFAAVRKDWE